MFVLLFWKTVVSVCRYLLPSWVCWLWNIFVAYCTCPHDSSQSPKTCVVIKCSGLTAAHCCSLLTAAYYCSLLTTAMKHFNRMDFDYVILEGVLECFFLCGRHSLSLVRAKAAGPTASACLTQRQSESRFGRETQSALRRALTTVQRTLQSLDSTHALKHRADSPQTDGSQWQRFCLFQRVRVLTQKGLFGWSNNPSMIKL